MVSVGLCFSIGVAHVIEKLNLKDLNVKKSVVGHCDCALCLHRTTQDFCELRLKRFHLTVFSVQKLPSVTLMEPNTICCSFKPAALRQLLSPQEF